MSIRVMSLVWDCSGASGAQLLLLLALADFGNDAGLDIYPSVETLARKTRRSVRSTIRDLEALELLGELECSKRGGRGRTNQYRVLVDNLRRKGANMAYQDSERVPDPAERVPDPFANSDTAVALESLEPLDRTAARLSDVVDRDEFLRRAREAREALERARPASVCR